MKRGNGRNGLPRCSRGGPASEPRQQAPETSGHRYRARKYPRRGGNRNREPLLNDDGAGCACASATCDAYASTSSSYATSLRYPKYSVTSFKGFDYNESFFGMSTGPSPQDRSARLGTTPFGGDISSRRGGNDPVRNERRRSTFLSKKKSGRIGKVPGPPGGKRAAVFRPGDRKGQQLS